MDINDMTRKEFEALPHREWNEEITFDSMIIIPAKIGCTIKYRIKRLIAEMFNFKSPDIWEISGIHDSGYRCMDFVAVKDGKPICLLSGCSDVIHIDGIGGYGKEWFERGVGVPDKIGVMGWSIDCLLKSGLLQMWPRTRRMTCSGAFSSFEIYALEREN